MVGLLEAYMKSKTEIQEKDKKIEALEKTNLELKEQIEKLTAEKQEKLEEVFLPKKHVIKEEVEVKKDKKAVYEKVEIKEKEGQHRSIRSRMFEEEMNKPRGFRNRDSSSSSNSSQDSRSRSKRSRSTRSRSRSRRSKSRERNRDKRRQDSDEKKRTIDLDEWRPKKGSDLVKVDPTLASIKEKLKQKQELGNYHIFLCLESAAKFKSFSEMAKKKEEDDLKKKQQFVALQPISSSQPTKDGKMEKLDTSKVAIQWGSQKGIKGKTPEPQLQVKKALPFVGKRPGKRDSASPAKSKFGSNVPNVPPPTLTTNLPISYAPPVPRKPPKNPTPKNVDLRDMLAAAKAHMIARGEAIPDHIEDKMDMDIPLPPLPAAQDRDPDALKVRYTRIHFIHCQRKAIF